ncbi:hypothetical protein [Burkholderia stabilis]
MGDQDIVGRFATTPAHRITGMPRRSRHAWRVAIIAAMAGWLSGSVCAAASGPTASTGARDGLIARPLAAPVSASHDGITESNRTVRESAAHAAAHAKARYPFKPAAASDTAKALGMTDAELTSWLADIRQQAATPSFRPSHDGEPRLYPMRPARPTDS